MVENTNNEKIVKSSIHFYCLNELYNTMASLASEGQRMYPGDQTYRFYFGCSLAFQGRIQEAIRELDRCVNDHDLSMGAILALIYTHKKSPTIDQNALDTLMKRLNNDVRSQSSKLTLYYGCLFLLLSKNFSDAKKSIEELNETHPNYFDGQVLYGWLICHYFHHQMADNQSLKKYIDIFATVTEPDVLIIQAKLYEKLANYNESIEKLNQAIVLYPKFLPALIEKIRLHSVMKEFESLTDTCIRTLTIDKHCIDPQRYLILYYLAWNFSEESALSRIQDLIHSLELREPKNGQLYYKTSRFIARLALENENILLYSSSLIEKAVFLEPTNIDFICEFAFQCSLLKRFQDAQRHYNNASKLNPDNNSKPMTGLLMTKLMEYDSNQASGLKGNSTLDKVHEEIDQLEEFDKTTTGLSANLLYLCLKSNFIRQKTRSSEVYLTKLYHYYNDLQNETLSIDYYAKMDVYQLIDIVQICLTESSPEPLVNGQQLPVVLDYGIKFLNLLSYALMNHKKILYLNAFVKYLTGEIVPALNMANRCLQYDSKYIDVHLLMANISLHNRNFKMANQSLENALLLDFQIRNNVTYILAKSSVLKHEKRYDEALELLKNALEMKPEGKSLKKSDQSTKTLKTNDRLLINLKMVDIYLMLNNTVEAKKLIQQLMNDNSQNLIIGGRLNLSMAKIQCFIGDYKNSLETLSNISKDVGVDHFIRSRQMMAAIYLSKYKDRKRFTDCYREILEHFPSQQAQLMFGDAYMKILEPEMAIEIYEQALKKNPKDSMLIRLVGQTLIKAHFYEKAVSYYKAAIKSSGQCPSFCFDLANLLFRLARNEQAKELILNTLKSSFDPKSVKINLETYIIKIKLLHLLARISIRLSDEKQAMKTLKDAHHENQKLMRRLPVEHPDLLEEHQLFSINLCKELAELLTNYDRNYLQALQIYKDSLVFDNRNNEIYLKMAKIELDNENFDQAHNYCTVILKNSPNMEEAILTMADIALRQADFEGALNLYNELLNKNPIYFIAIVRYIEACRRLGKLNLVPDLLNKAENYAKKLHLSDAKTTTTTELIDVNKKAADALSLCRGLYEWFTGNGNKAIKYLSNAVHHPDLGRLATLWIVEIFLHPDYQLEMESPNDLKFGAKNSIQKTAETLLENLMQENSQDLEIILLNNLALLNRKQKSDTENVLSNMIKFGSVERYNNHAGILYVMIMAYLALKQTPKSRNQLKRFGKFPWKYSEAEYLEKGWLLLADVNLQNNKFDNANELLKKILRYNKSCSKAYEYSGIIMEKDQSYRDAAFNYEQAWNYTNGNNVTIGYKLAYNYMKAKHYSKAIDICQQILDNHPDYSKIRKDIMDKCLNNIKC